jgi:hypothetical protein
VLANGEKKRWNGHPFFAIRPPNACHGMVADYGSLVKGPDEFIEKLIEPSHGVRAVFSGHNHRDGLHTLWRMGPQSGPQTNGRLRVRLVRAPVKSVKPGSILGPLWVNTTSAGFRGHYRPGPGEDYYVPPGRALVSVRSDGTIDVTEFRRLPGIDKRERAQESILDEIGFDRNGSGEMTPALGREGGSQLESSFDDQLAGVAELVMSRAAGGWARDRQPGDAPVGLAEEGSIVEKLTRPGFEAYIDDELRMFEDEGRTGRRILPDEPVKWSGDELQLGPQCTAVGGPPCATAQDLLARSVLRRARKRCDRQPRSAGDREDSSLVAGGDGYQTQRIFHDHTRVAASEATLLVISFACRVSTFPFPLLNAHN